jgi:histidine triad (HIT) family protein
MSNNNCPFCKMVKHELSPVVVQEDDEILAIMDLYPATPGHVLVLPKRHIEDIYAMPSDTGARIMTVVISIAKVIREQLRPSGLNLIQANETAAGQTISHFHLHIVPRYQDDSVTLRFGHGNTPEDIGDLERIASLLRSGLNI